MEDVIKPCPFDGGHAEMQEIVHAFFNEDRYWVVCMTCACEGPWATTRSGALRGWNMRVHEPTEKASE
jgi:hypothetical protein